MFFTWILYEYLIGSIPEEKRSYCISNTQYPLSYPNSFSYDKREWISWKSEIISKLQMSWIDSSLNPELSSKFDIRFWLAPDNILMFKVYLVISIQQVFSGAVKTFTCSLIWKKWFVRKHFASIDSLWITVSISRRRIYTISFREKKEKREKQVKPQQ